MSPSLLFCSVLLLVLVARWVFQQRHILRFTLQAPGPSLWQVATTLASSSASEDVYDIVLNHFGKLPELACTWLGAYPVCLIKTPESLKVVYNSPKTLNKNILFDFLKPMYGDGLLTAKDSVWRRHRKLINPTFSTKILDGFVEIFAEETAMFLQELDGFDGKGVFDICECLNNFLLQVLCETAMGLKNMENKSSLFAVGRIIERMNEITLIRMMNIFYYPKWIFFRTKVGREQRRLIEEYNSVAGSVLKAKRIQFNKTRKNEATLHFYHEEDEPKKRKAFLDYLIEISENDNADKFTDSEILQEVATFIFGGSETSAVTLSNLFCMLAIHPEIQERVYRETIDLLGSDRPVLAEDLPNLKYTEMVIKETLRLFPIVMITGRHVAEDLVLNDKVTVPAGIDLLLFTMELQRSAEYFPEPLAFKPERFLPEQTNSRHPYAFTSFSGGNRNCIGINYAMRVMKVVVSTLIRKYQFFTKYKKVEDVEVKWSLTLRVKNGYKVSIVSRK